MIRRFNAFSSKLALALTLILGGATLGAASVAYAQVEPGGGDPPECEQDRCFEVCGAGSCTGQCDEFPNSNIGCTIVSGAGCESYACP